MLKIEKAVSWMEKTAKDNAHGYDQIYRWGEKGDYDCSAAVITACQEAGIPLKTNGATYTGNLYQAALKTGFKDVTKSVTLANGKGLVRGDILLAEGHHTAMYCGDGMEAEASINEKGTAKGGKPGDQTGREFLIRPYRNYPWTKVLRYPEEKTEKKGSTGTKAVKYKVTAKSGLNVRNAPGGTKIGALKFGTVVKNDGTTKEKDGTAWYKITSSIVDGWVSGQYLAKV